MWQGVKCQIYISEAIIILCKSKACHHRYSHFRRERTKSPNIQVKKKKKKKKRKKMTMMKKEEGRRWSTFFLRHISYPANIRNYNAAQHDHNTPEDCRIGMLGRKYRTKWMNEWMNVKVLKHTQETHGFICMAPHTPSTEAIDVRWDSTNGIQGARHIYILCISMRMFMLYI